MVRSLRRFQPGMGLHDWLIQRASAVVIAAYVFFIVAFLLCHPRLQFITWHALFANVWMRVFSLLFLSALILHAWIGLWTVCTDYLKPTALRLLVLSLLLIALFGFFLWGILIFWGIGL